ncbi:hypothetical protein M2150_001790 [Lachnospiraceae bacterium PM6-15]|uniref:LPD28 domain-containing protein n=1 Tax=Ohessyouella blattaphilus TaxID=2949333 RepID=UPI003E30C729
MARANAMTERFEEMTILWKPALFTPIRIDRASVPVGYNMYEVRHDDNGWGEPVQIARGIMVNHWGTLITRDPIKLDRDGRLDITPEDFKYDTGKCQSMEDFIKTYPAKEQLPKECER